MKGVCEYVEKAVADIQSKHELVAKYHKGPWTWTESSNKRSKLRESDMTFGTWNIKGLYRAGLLMRITKEISK
jgi:hypothetical protein